MYTREQVMEDVKKYVTSIDNEELLANITGMAIDTDLPDFTTMKLFSEVVDKIKKDHEEHFNEVDVGIDETLVSLDELALSFYFRYYFLPVIDVAPTATGDTYTLYGSPTRNGNFIKLSEVNLDDTENMKRTLDESADKGFFFVAVIASNYTLVQMLRAMPAVNYVQPSNTTVH